MSRASSIKPVRVWDCAELCRSEEHATQLFAAVTKRNLSDQQVACYFIKTCRNFGKITDGLGKTVLHFAASCGRRALCEWLITKAESNVNAVDHESGYTPLHSALFYGYVDVAVKLIELGGKLTFLDREHLSPISLLSLETSSVTPLDFTFAEAYVCGSNLNYTLGVGTNDPKKTPEILEFFRRNSLSIKEICMEEFHTVFVTSCHLVYVCGHGQGGRLGIGKEKPLLIPTLLPTRGESCVQAAVGLNHTLLLLANGAVLSCGSNVHHQLGISPYADHSPTPRAVNTYSTRAYGIITAVRAAKYHSVFTTNKAIFACGLNAGQLGTRNNMDFHTVPQLLATVGRDCDKITHVTTSLGSVSFATTSGDIFTFHQFQCRKITRCLDIVRMESQGGRLASVMNGIDNGEDLKMVWLTKRGTVYIWHEKKGISRCSIGAGRLLSICDICLRNDTLYMVTKYGEAFSGFLKIRETGLNIEKSSKTADAQHWCTVNMKQIANVHRALSITCDYKGKNIAIIQAHPSNNVGFSRTRSRTTNIASQLKNFWEQTSEYDDVHDIVFLVGDTKMAAHKFILASRGCSSAMFHKPTIQVPAEIPIVIFKELLKFIYTDHSDILEMGRCKDIFLDIDDPLKKLNEAAVFAGLEQLQTELQHFWFESGFIFHGQSRMYPPKMSFDRQNFPDMWDVEVVCEDSVVLKAHKCILAARMEYFNNMFTRGWTEAGAGRKIHLQSSSRIVSWILSFLYTDGLPDVLGCDDLDNVIKLLIASDQYLIDDLKDECAIYLSEMLSLKNCTMILQLASTYNEQSLKVSVMKYIAHNLNAVIENRYLEMLDDVLLTELRDFSRNFLAVKYKEKAVSTFFNVPPDDAVLQASQEWCGTDAPPDFPVINDDDCERQKLSSGYKKKPARKNAAFSPTAADLSQVESIPLSVSVDSTHSQSSFESSFDACQFPVLSESFEAKTISSSPKTSYEPRRVYPPKLSQKQRKKLSTEFEEKLDLSREENKPKQPRGWAKIESPTENFLDSAQSPVCRPTEKAQDSCPNMAEIMAIEQQKRTNLRKMTSKPFHLTQIEDAAMVDLEEFYSVGNCFDERISVVRVVPLNVAEPTWMPLSRKLPVL